MKDSITNIDYKRKLKLFILKLGHFFLSVALFFFAWMQFRYHGVLPVSDVGFRYNYFITVAYGVIIFFFYKTYNSYLLGYRRIRSLVFAQALSQFFGILIIYFLVSIAWNKFYTPVAFLFLLLFQFLLDVIWSFFGNKYFYHLIPPKRTILIYRNLLDRKRFGSLTGKPSEHIYQISEELMYDGSFRELEEKLKGYEAVFVSGVNSCCRNGILKYCKEHNVRVFFLPHIGDVIMKEAVHIQSFDSPVLCVDRKVLNPEYAVLKRLFDISLSLAGIIILSPVMAITAVAIKMFDGGPAIYKQVRLTKDSREFEIYKFRSMCVDAEKDGIARLSTGDKDKRITPVGKFIRKCRIDELPQLFNILIGDMSVVGPRPERPEIAEQYYKTIPEFKLRLQVKAGLTGYAQIYGKYNTDPYEKLEFDLLYINNMSVLTDIELVFATFFILFNSESTAGVKEGTINALDYKSDR